MTQIMEIIASLMGRIDQFDLAMYYVAGVCLFLSRCFGQHALNCIKGMQEPISQHDPMDLVKRLLIEPMRGKVSRRMIVPATIAPVLVIFSFQEIPLEFTLAIYAASSIALVSCATYNCSAYIQIADFNGAVNNEKNQMLARKKTLAALNKASSDSGN